MNREIKFRGHTGTEWVYGFLWGSIDPTKEDTTFRAWFIYTGVSIEEGHKVDRASVGQFTGLLDKNGKEIWEGDILEFDPDEWGSTKGNRWAVEWNDEDGSWSTGGGTNRECRVWKKVIGNVYERPDLLK